MKTQIHKLFFLVFLLAFSTNIFSQWEPQPSGYPQAISYGSDQGCSAGIRMELRDYNNSAIYQWELQNNAYGHGFNIFDRTAYAYRFCINTIGNVGIGTTSPTAKLHVSSTSATPFMIDWNTSSSWSYASLINVNQNYAKCWAVRQNVDMFYVLGNGNLYTAGDVSIGTTNNQGYKMAVNGGIICEEVKVITDVPASDYVFKKDYKLSSLSEVEKYVQEHQHLPEVQSAEEFKKNGYTLGEMDNILLKKVEEITLYLIDLKKENEQLKEEIANLKK